MNNLAIFKLDIDYLKEGLCMPRETTIEEVWLDSTDNTLGMVVEHPELREVKEGEEIPVVSPIMHTIVWDWNQHE